MPGASPNVASRSEVSHVSVMATATNYPHITVDDQGEARIERTRLKVKHVVAERLANGWSPEEVAWQHEGLTLAQVYSALAYYEDHRSEIDAAIARDESFAAATRHAQAETELMRRLATLRATGR